MSNYAPKSAAEVPYLWNAQLRAALVRLTLGQPQMKHMVDVRPTFHSAVGLQKRLRAWYKGLTLFPNAAESAKVTLPTGWKLRFYKELLPSGGYAVSFMLVEDGMAGVENFEEQA